MKDVLRSALGTLFLLVFLLTLFLGAVKVKVLQEKFWTDAIDKSGVYSQVLTNIDDLQSKSDAITKPKGLPRIVLVGALTEKRLQEVVSANIQRLLAFLNGQTSEIMVYLPFQEWGVPGVKFAKDTNITEILTSQNLPVEQKQQILSGLQTFQLVSKNVGTVSLGIFVLAFVLLAGHGFLGELKGTGILLVVAGVITAIIGKLGESFGWLIAKDPKLPIWGKLLIQQLVKDFFSLGMVVGLIIAGVGVVMAFKFKSQNKNLILGIVKNIFGIILALLLIGGTVLGIAYKLGANKSWSLNIPKDWKTTENKERKSITYTNSKIVIIVEPLARNAVIDSGSYAQQLVQNFKKTGFKGTFVGNPKEDVWQSWKRFVFMYDQTDTKSDLKVRILRWELYPIKSGNGFGLHATTRVSDWPTYESQITSILESFKVK